MALVDNFDSYNDGDLNGQGGWSGSVNFDVQGVTVAAGAKAVGAGRNNTSIRKTFTGQSAGNQRFAIRATDNSAAPQVQMMEGSNIVINILFFNYAGYGIAYYNGSAWVSITAISNNTWYEIETEWQTTPSKQARYRWREWAGTWSDWTAFANPNAAWTTEINGIDLRDGSGLGGSGTCNFDELSDPNAAPPVTTYDKLQTTRARIKTADIAKLVQVRARIKTPDITKVITSKGRVLRTFLSQLTEKARVKATGEKLLSSKASIVDVGKTYLYLPESGSSAPSPATFQWYIPSNRWAENLNFQLQVDKTDDTFGDLEVEKKSWQDSGFEYWDGDSWEPIPVSGVANSFAGNLVRFATALTGGLKFWRVKAFAG